MMRVNIAPMNNICPRRMVPTMPFLFRSIEHMRKVLDGPIGDEILEALRDAGLRRPGLLRQRRALDLHGKKPIKTLADMKGLKVRVQQSDLWVALLEAMGANADADAVSARSTPA